MTKTIGILGGGQLGRMTAQAAAKLGYQTHIFTPERNGSAEQAANHTTHADYHDLAALKKFSSAVDVVTYEFENIPVAAVETIVAIKPVYPNARALSVCQNRVREKSLCRELMIATAPWCEVHDMASAARAMCELGGSMILKTAEMGYDGKGQAKIINSAELEKSLGQMRGQLIAEGIVKFDFEISVIAARGMDGEVKCYPPVRNEHKNHILWQTHAPAEISETLTMRAMQYATQLIEQLNVVGLLAVEMFVVGDEILVNEMAPRPHNSGHWTIEGCQTSQFEQLVRAITGMKLGDVEPRGKFVMTNLIGDDFKDGAKKAAAENGTFHDYGKIEIRPGRKMGHITRQVG
ncbi:MAG TPA: 5-(carboxyamino)imidazole ribonucleotide synthase [Alphaproteobacteria bacterium]|nr:5-(carboxyamino)imidazole ribonucleotide synthase [Alphaproteobacteria bacterium]